MAEDLMGFDRPEDMSSEMAEYWRIIYGNLRNIIAITGLVMLCSIFYFSTKPNLYTATVSILVEKADTRPPNYQEVITPSFRGEDDYYGTQMAILTGRKIQEEITSRLELSHPFEMDTKRVRATRIITLSVTYPNPELAATIANMAAEIYVKQSVQENLFMSRQILKLMPEDASEVQSTTTDFSKEEFAQSLPSVINDPVVQKLRGEKMEVESQVKELAQRYKPDHPMMRELMERLNYVEEAMQDRVNSISTNLKATLKGEVNISNIRVLEDALAPNKPSKPNRLLGVLMHTFLGLLGSVFLVLGMEYTNQKIRMEEDLRLHVHMPFLGYIPLTKDLVKSKKGFMGHARSLVEILKNNETLSDAIASVRTHILFSMPYEKSKRIMFTSVIPNEGKTTVAALLALSLTGLGRKILLIDADLRRPFLHTYFNLPNGKGLTDFLIGNATLDEIVVDIPDSELKMTRGGTISPNPSELLSSDHFRDLLDRLSEKFDRIVIDVPPALYIPDSLVVAKYIHSGILVCGSGMVHKKSVLTVKDKFNAIGHSFIGAVINRANYERDSYHYRYYKHYKSYYARSGSKSKDKT